MTFRNKNSKHENLRRGKRAFRTVIILFLIFILASLTCTPAGTTPKNATTTAAAGLAATLLLFSADADAQVNESNPTDNYGNSTFLQVDGASDPDVESFIRFTVMGLSGGVQNARLRVYDTTNASTNGPAVYATETSWTETGITWQTRPARLSEALDNKGSISTNTWVEYDVTAWVKGNGAVSFVLAADSNDAATFSSRQGSQPPQLIITPADGPTVTPETTTVTTTSPTTPPTSTLTPTPANALTILAEADTYARQSSPNTNYGNAPTLQVDGASDSDYEAFLRFSVTGVSSEIENALLRVYVTTNGTRNGPAVYATNTSWTETGVTWNKRPARTGAAVDNKDRLNTETWVEYDVTPLVTGNGTFSFVLVADSRDAVLFSSRQGSQPPQLVVTFRGSEPSTITPTFTPTELVDGEIFVGAGDISECDNDNDEFTAQLLDATPGTVFTTGDNAYDSGTLTEYRNCYDPTWGRHKDRTKPIPGNHEYRSSAAAGYFQYFDNIPSYYAYDLGSWRIYAMNSEIDVSANSPQVTWLQEDLAANPRQCVLAYWHQPRWSSGSNHGNDTEYQTLWQILYEAGAEVVLNGHEHNYERFTPMNASGQPDSRGLRAFVVGTGGRDLYDLGSPLPTSEARNDTTFGVLKVILRETGYDWEFIPIAGSTFTDSGSTDCH